SCCSSCSYASRGTRSPRPCWSDARRSAATCATRAAWSRARRPNSDRAGGGGRAATFEGAARAGHSVTRQRAAPERERRERPRRTPGGPGTYGSRNRKDHSYDGYAFATSAQVKGPRLWDWLGKAGLHTVVLGVPQTYPPSAVNGEMVSCFLTPSTRSEYTYPPALKAEVEQVTGGYVLDVEDFRTADKAGLLKR